jgi:hypothetical protein
MLNGSPVSMLLCSRVKDRRDKLRPSKEQCGILITDILLQIWRISVNLLNKLLWMVNKGWTTSLVMGRGLTSLIIKELECYELLQRDL